MPSVSVILNSNNFVDAYIYRSEIYCWTFENVLQIYRIEDVIRVLESHHKDVGLAAAHILFSFRGIGTNRQLSGAFSRARIPSAEPLQIQVKPVSTFKFSPDFEFLLDLRIHYDRLYLATESGSFGVSIKRQEDRTYAVVQTDVLHESYSYALSTGLRAVAISLGKLGLSIILNEADISSDQRTQVHLDDLSIRSAISSSAVASFSANDVCRIYSASSTKATTRESRTLTDVSQESLQIDSDSAPVAEGYLYWDGWNSRLVSATANQLAGYMPRTQRKSPTINDLYSLDSEPLSVGMTRNRFVAIESQQQVLLTRDGRSHQFDTGSCLSVRTYRNSFRFRRTVTCTAASGLWLIAAYGGSADDF